MPRHANPEQLEKTVRYLTQTVHPRSADNIDNLNRSAEYIKEVFVSSGARITSQDVPITGGPYKTLLLIMVLPMDRWLLLVRTMTLPAVMKTMNWPIHLARMITPAAWQDYSNWYVCYISKYRKQACSWSPMRRKNRPSFVAMKWERGTCSFAWASSKINDSTGDDWLLRLCAW